MSQYTGSIEKTEFEQDINWFEVLRCSVRQRTTGLVWRNLRRIGVSSLVPTNVRIQLEAARLYNSIRAEQNIDSFRAISAALSEEGITHAPLKGIYLLQNVYRDAGVRYSNDIDVLVRRSDIDKIADTMSRNGYTPGEYDGHRHAIRKKSRQRTIMWAMHSSNLPPYLRLPDDCDSEWPICIDFRHSIDGRSSIVEQMLDEVHVPPGGQRPELRDDDFFLHLVFHLMWEATNFVSLVEQKSLNLSKLCDARELIVCHDSPIGFLGRTIERAMAFGLLQYVKFTLQLLSIVFGEEFADHWIDKLGGWDNELMMLYGAKDYPKPLRWETSPLMRLFHDEPPPPSPQWTDI